METVCWALLLKGKRLAGDISFGRFGHQPSIQAIGNALRHARRYGLVKSKVVGPGNRSIWWLTDKGLKAAINPFDPH
jgi:hypothetical protein